MATVPPEHAVSDVPTGNVDIAPTLLHLLGLAPAPTMTGRVIAEGLHDGPAIASVGVERFGAALDSRARRPTTFMQVLDMVATMPYDRRLRVGEELAERFEIDQARLRVEGNMFLNPEDLAGFATDGCEVANHTRSHIFCRSVVDRESADFQIVQHARRLESLTGRPVRAFRMAR